MPSLFFDENKDTFQYDDGLIYQMKSVDRNCFIVYVCSSSDHIRSSWYTPKQALNFFNVVIILYLVKFGALLRGYVSVVQLPKLDVERRDVLVRAALVLRIVCLNEKHQWLMHNFT